jgi:cytoskeletal protein CcmA (bactofilin family)
MAIFKKSIKQMDSRGREQRTGANKVTSAEGTLIEKSLRIKGTISGGDAVTVLGSFEGECALKSNLDIGETAAVKGQFSAEVITVSGKIEGEVKANDRIHLESTARMAGRVQTKKLSVAEGALFDGELQMTSYTHSVSSNSPADKK